VLKNEYKILTIKAKVKEKYHAMGPLDMKLGSNGEK